jgi:hypothetical protein
MNVCAICHAPATGFVNVMASAASSVPSAFEARCDAHNPYRFDFTAHKEEHHHATDRGGSSTARTASVSRDTVPHVVAGRPDPSIRLRSERGR